MKKYKLKENNFEPAPGGSMGTLNYSVGYGTPGGGNISQNPDKFSSSDKTVNHMNNESSHSMVIGKLPERPNRKSSSGAPIHPSSMSDQGSFENSSPSGDAKSPNTIDFNNTSPLPDENSSTLDPDTKTNDTTDPNSESKPIDPTKGLDKQVDKLFKKRITPSPDEVLSALQWEMNQMVKKDKYIAKQIVLKNLKRDPNYYSRLFMLNIEDDKMRVDEQIDPHYKYIYKTNKDGEDKYYAAWDVDIINKNLVGKHELTPDEVKYLVNNGWVITNLNENKKTTFDKTKAVLDQMITDRNKDRPVKNSKEINAIFKELWNKRHGFKKS